MSWGSSNKTTSGHFAHDLNGKPLFVSDFVEFQCNRHDCQCRKSMSSADLHFGRVRCVGINHIEGSKRNGKVELEVQECLGSGHSILSTAALNPPLVENEFVLTWNIHFILEANVFAVNYSGDIIALDYRYADDKLSDTSNNSQIKEGQEFIRRTLDIGDGRNPLPLNHDYDETPLCRQAPLRGKLEMEAYGRQYFLDMDEYVRNGGTIWSIPYLSFIDGAYLIHLKLQ